MTDELEHITKAGETIEFSKAGKDYLVECWDKANNSRWCKSFRKREDAIKEFER